MTEIKIGDHVKFKLGPDTLCQICKTRIICFDDYGYTKCMNNHCFDLRKDGDWVREINGIDVGDTVNTNLYLAKACPLCEIIHIICGRFTFRCLNGHAFKMLKKLKDSWLRIENTKTEKIACPVCGIGILKKASEYALLRHYKPEPNTPDYRACNSCNWIDWSMDYGGGAVPR